MIKYLFNFEGQQDCATRLDCDIISAQWNYGECRRLIQFSPIPSTQRSPEKRYFKLEGDRGIIVSITYCQARVPVNAKIVANGRADNPRDARLLASALETIGFVKEPKKKVAV